MSLRNIDLSRSSHSLTCSFCDYLAVTKADYLNHVKRKHRFHPQFKVTCSFPSCKFTSKSWASFKVHVSKKHRNEVLDNEVINTDTETNPGHAVDVMDVSNSTSNQSINGGYPQCDVLSCITNLCMKLECKHRCSQVALNELIDGLSNVINMTDETNKNSIQQHLDTLQTQYRRNKVYKNHWAYIPQRKLSWVTTIVQLKEKQLKKYIMGITSLLN